MSRNIKFASGEFFHVYNRGTEKRKIFNTQKDYDRFLALLYVSNGTSPVHLQLQGRTLKEVGEKNAIEQGKQLVDICSYCLMPNHFHLLLHEKEENGISKFMQKIGNGYTGYFNKLNERTGSLFQGKFKATHVNNDNYLKYLISYIHLNPIKLIDHDWKIEGIKDRKKAEKFLSQYKYSSYLDYVGNTRDENIIINKEALPKYFETLKDFEKHLSFWLNFKVEP